MLIEGTVDAIFGWASEPGKDGAEAAGGTIDRLVSAGLDRSSLAIVWRSQPLRYGPHVLRQGLDAEVRTILVRFLTALRSFQPDVYDLLETDHGGGFVEVGPQDYAAVVEMVRRAGVAAGQN
jgi:phosphonate transport system substrate-binding protein